MNAILGDKAVNRVKLTRDDQKWLSAMQRRLAERPTHATSWVENEAQMHANRILYDGGLGNPLLPFNREANHVRNYIGKVAGGNLYGKEGGMDPVKEAAIGFFEKVDGFTLSSSQILVDEQGSCRHLGYVAEALIRSAEIGEKYTDEAGDLQVLIEAPAYGRHISSLPTSRLRYHTADLYSRESEGRGFAKELEYQVAKHHAKLVVISSARNPTCRVITERELNSAIEICSSHRAVLFVDQAYHHVYRESNGPITSVLKLKAAAGKRVVATLSASKGHQSPGTGGLLFGDEWVVKRAAMVRRDKGEGGFVPTQMGLAYMLRHPEILAHTREKYDEHMQYLVQTWSQAGWKIPMSPATIFLYGGMPKAFQEAGWDCRNFAKLLARNGVIVYPSELFPGSDGKSIRICARNTRSHIERAAQVISRLNQNPPVVNGSWPSYA